MDSFNKTLNPADAQNRLLCVNKVNTMATDTLPPYIARSSAAIVLTMWDKQVLVFHEEGF